MWMKRSDYQAHVKRLSSYIKCSAVLGGTLRETSRWSIIVTAIPPTMQKDPLLSFVDVKCEDVIQILRDDWSRCLQSGTPMPIARVRIYGEYGNPQEVVWYSPWKDTMMQAAEGNISSKSPSPSTITRLYYGDQPGWTFSPNYLEHNIGISLSRTAPKRVKRLNVFSRNLSLSNFETL